jgi:hypothetical protein
MKNSKIIFVLSLLCLFFFSCQDNPVETDEQFVQIYFKYDFRNELNTFDNTYKKDLVLDGVIKVKFWLTAEEQNKILAKVIELNYFLLPDTLKYIPQDSIYVSIEPNPGEQKLRIKYLSNDKAIIWTYPLNDDNADVKALYALQNFIITIIESKPEYKRLPPRRGGYL